MDDLVYSSMISFYDIAFQLIVVSYLVVMSMWQSNSRVITAGACLVSAFIYGNHCVIANGRGLLNGNKKNDRNYYYVLIIEEYDYLINNI